MNLFTRYAAAAIAVLSVACACSRQELDLPIAVNVTMTGSISGDTFTDDQGLDYRMTGTAEGVSLTDMDRALVTVNVIGKISDKEYSAYLLSLYKPLCKKVAMLSAATDEMLREDPVLIDTGWISGGYVNLGITFSRLKESDTAHQIELILDDSTAGDGTLRFTLHHNGFGEGFADEGNRSSYDDVAGFVCFNVSGLLPDGIDSMPVSITAPWYETVGDDIRTGNVIEIVTKGRLSR